MSETVETPQTEAAPAAAPEPEVNAADDLRAAIGAAYDEAEAAANETPAEPEKEAEPEPAKPEEPESKPAEAAERDAQGRFAPREAVIPPEIAPVKAVLDEFQHMYAARGVQPADAMRALFSAHQALQTNPEAALRQLAHEFRVDLGKLAPAAAAPGSDDPLINATLARIAQIEQFQAQQQQEAKTQRAEAERRANNEVARMIQTFSADPKHPHFPAVSKMMGALMTAGEAADLAEAYDMACRAHPAVSKAIQAAEVAARDKAAADAQRKAAADAKAKAVSLRNGTAPVTGFRSPPDSLRATIEAVYDGRLN